MRGYGEDHCRLETLSDHTEMIWREGFVVLGVSGEIMFVFWVTYSFKVHMEKPKELSPGPHSLREQC